MSVARIHRDADWSFALVCLSLSLSLSFSLSLSLSPLTKNSQSDSCRFPRNRLAKAAWETRTSGIHWSREREEEEEVEVALTHTAAGTLCLPCAAVEEQLNCIHGY